MPLKCKSEDVENILRCDKVPSHQVAQAGAIVPSNWLPLPGAEADTSHVKQRADSADIVRVTVTIMVQRFMGMKMSNT